MSCFQISKISQYKDQALVVPKAAAHLARGKAIESQKRVVKVAVAIRDEFKDANSPLEKGVFWTKLLVLPLVGNVSTTPLALAKSAFLLKGVESFRRTYDMTCLIKDKLCQSGQEVSVYVRGYLQDNPDLNPVIKTGLKCALYTSGASVKAVMFTGKIALSTAKAVALQVIPFDALSKNKQTIAICAIAALAIAPTAMFGLRIMTLAVKGMGAFSFAMKGIEYTEKVRNSETCQKAKQLLTEKIVGRELTEKENEIATVCALLAATALIYVGGTYLAKGLSNATSGASSIIFKSANVGALAYMHFRCYEELFCEHEPTDVQLSIADYDRMGDEYRQRMEEINDVEEMITLHNELKKHKKAFETKLKSLEKASSLDHLSAKISFARFETLEKSAQLKAGDLIQAKVAEIKALRFDPLEGTKAGSDEAYDRALRASDQRDYFVSLVNKLGSLTPQARHDVSEVVGILGAMIKVHSLDRDLIDLQIQLNDESSLRDIKRNKAAFKSAVSKLNSFERLISKHKTQLDKVQSNFRYMDERRSPVALAQGAAELVGQREHVDAEQIQHYFASRVEEMIKSLDRAELALAPELVPIMMIFSTITNIPFEVVVANMTAESKKAEIRSAQREFARVQRSEIRNATKQSRARVGRAPRVRANRYQLRSGR